MSGCMGTGKMIQVLLSTYNGARYLREQLDSIKHQKNYEDVCILIRDDGSTDGTCEILRDYATSDHFEVEYGENIGITESYSWLLEHRNTRCSYFAISDQDDVWLEDKLQEEVKLFQAVSEDTPCLVGSCTRIVNQDLEPIGKVKLPRKKIAYYNAMIQNVIPGHTQIMNNRLVQLLLKRGFSDVHVIDWWNYLVASGVGVVKFYYKPTVLYRQHTGNAIGAINGHPWKKLNRRLQYIREGRGNAFSKQLYAFHNRYCDLLSTEFRAENEKFFGAMNTVGSRIRYAVQTKAYRQEKLDTLLFKFLYILGKYKL